MYNGWHAQLQTEMIGVSAAENDGYQEQSVPSFATTTLSQNLLQMWISVESDS
jgi:hypothetical protein